jgi:hypothetical protein
MIRVVNVRLGLQAQALLRIERGELAELRPLAGLLGGHPVDGVEAHQRVELLALVAAHLDGLTALLAVARGLDRAGDGVALAQPVPLDHAERHVDVVGTGQVAAGAHEGVVVENVEDAGAGRQDIVLGNLGLLLELRAVGAAAGGAPLVAVAPTVAVAAAAVAAVLVVIAVLALLPVPFLAVTVLLVTVLLTIASLLTITALAVTVLLSVASLLAVTALVVASLLTIAALLVTPLLAIAALLLRARAVAALTGIAGLALLVAALPALVALAAVPATRPAVGALAGVGAGLGRLLRALPRTVPLARAIGGVLAATLAGTVARVSRRGGLLTVALRTRLLLGSGALLCRHAGRGTVGADGAAAAGGLGGRGGARAGHAGAGLLRPDHVDEVALAHLGRAGDAHAAGESLQFSQAHGRQGAGSARLLVRGRCGIERGGVGHEGPFPLVASGGDVRGC